MSMTFGRWLLLQTRRDDPIGELARFADEDMAMPIDAKGQDRWFRYLSYRKAETDLSDALALAWGEWERGEGYPGPAKREWRICHLDREYAFTVGDPVLATVEAEDQREALKIASGMGLQAPSGLWAYQGRN